ELDAARAAGQVCGERQLVVPDLRVLGSGRPGREQQVLGDADDRVAEPFAGDDGLGEGGGVDGPRGREKPGAERRAGSTPERGAVRSSRVSAAQRPDPTALRGASRGETPRKETVLQQVT